MESTLDFAGLRNERRPVNSKTDQPPVLPTILGNKLPPIFLAALLALGVSARAASVGPSGYTNGFDSAAPVAGDWATLSGPGVSGDILDAVALNARVQTNVASIITNVLATDMFFTPPQQSLNAVDE